MDTTNMALISEEVNQLHKYLANRGIPQKPEFFDFAGIELAGSERIAEILGYQVPHGLGIAFKYPNTDYATVRVISSSDPKFIGPRCPKGKRPAAYLSPFTQWDTVQGTLVICESPLKALTWGMYGYHAMAAGGVTTVYMPRHQQWCDGFPHAAIEAGAITEVKIAWDSDIHINHDVARALRVLVRELRERHPTLKIRIHELTPPPEGWPKDSWGVDDAHHHYGADWFKQWAEDDRLSRDPEADELQQHFDQLDQKYVVNLANGTVINVDMDTSHPMAVFKGVIEAPRKVIGEKGRRIPVAGLWLERVDRPEVVGRRYLPGRPTLCTGAEGLVFNAWRESPVQPVKGDVSRWLDLINDAVRDDEVRLLMLQCMAYQVQNREHRLEKLLYFVGREVGTGKSTMARIMQKVMGSKNTGWVTKTELESNFNACWAAKELVVLDDISKLRRDTWAKLKTHITSNEVTLTEKNLPSWSQQNYATLYITSNQADVIATDTEDRRVLMIQFEPSMVHRGEADTYWSEFYAWLESGGYEAIAHYLGTMDLSEFNPHFYPPASDLKDEAILAGLDDETAFLERFRADPNDYVHPDRLFVTSRELFIFMTGTNPNEFNTKEQKKLANMASTRSMYKRAWKGQVRHGGHRVMVYWIPGREITEEIRLGQIQKNLALEKPK